MSRPLSHPTHGADLPPLQPDGQTWLSRLGSPDDGELPTDILERLRALQEKDSAAMCSHVWGEAQTSAREALEAFGHAEDEHESSEAERAALEVIANSSDDVRVVDRDGFSLLHYASMYGSLEAVAALLRRKANLHTRTKVHESPLQLAAYYRHADVVALLLAHRARADLADWQGRTPLEAAKASLCGNGKDRGPALQARCVELLQKQQGRVDSSEGLQVDSWREQGNGFFKKGNFAEAVAAYSIGLSVQDDAALYANRAECYLKLGRFVEAKFDARKAVGLAGEAGHKKASWRLARACLALGDCDGADAALKEGLSHFGDDAALLQLRNEVILERRKRLGIA